MKRTRWTFRVSQEIIQAQSETAHPISNSWQERSMSLIRFSSLLVFACGAVLPSALVAQGQAEPAIEDNSFLIEEAYNQEPGVVQHISTFAVTGASRRDLFYTFTQEWPFKGQKHQLSYTIPVTRLNAQSAGFGDIVLNYRMQFGGGDLRWAFAPRLSAVLPTGSVSRGLGDGSPGLQLNFPVSFEVTSDVVTHLNAGGTLLPWAEGPAVVGKRPKRTLTNGFLGGSIIAPTRLPVQLMVENLVTFNEEIVPGGDVDRSTSWILSPGIRAAFNFGSLQVVPGFAVPFTRTSGETVHDYLIYLSFEHPFSTSSQTVIRADSAGARE